ncbi:MAG: hypothetical protein ACPL28_10495 [bacterium]
MICQKEVDEWLCDFLQKLKKRFKERLISIGHHGSWAMLDCLNFLSIIV